MLIEYIGRKAKQTDNTAGTGTVWFGAGDVKEVPDEAAVKLLAYDTIYALAKPPAAVDKPADKPAEPKHLAEMDDAEMREFARVNSINVDKRKKGEALRAAILDAMAA